jgi:D-alanine-D-alanine ligase
MADPHAPFRGRGDENIEYAGADAADRAFARAMDAAGFDARLVPIHLGDMDEKIAALDCDAVFNLCDGTGAAGDGNPGLEVVEALEWRGLPYTGARPEAYRIGSDKVGMKERFRASGVPTPAFQVFRAAEDPIDPAIAGRLPLIVKPCDSGGSAGVHIRSVVTSEAELRERVAEVVGSYGEALVEEYVDGREITVALLGGGRDLVALPAVEVRFGAAFPEGRGIRTFETKWDPSSPLYSAFETLCPAPLTPLEARRVHSVARAAYRAIGGSGYGRVDLRLDARGPFALEVNPNCSLEWSDESLADCGMFPIAARAAGLDYPALLRALVERALRVAPRLRAARRARWERLKAVRGAESFAHAQVA